MLSMVSHGKNNLSFSAFQFTVTRSCARSFYFQRFSSIANAPDYGYNDSKQFNEMMMVMMMMMTMVMVMMMMMIDDDDDDGDDDDDFDDGDE